MAKKGGIDFAAVPATAIKVVTSPGAFFREMPKTGGFGEPLVFMIVMGVVAGLVQAILSIIGLNVGMGIGMAIATLIIFPVVIAIFGFIGAAIAFVIWKLMGSQEPYETAYRCVAYITALWPITTILGTIPYVGMLLAVVLVVYFYATASIETHKIAAQTAWIVSGVIGLILIAMAISADMTSRAMKANMLKYQQQMEEMQRQMPKK